MSFKKIFVLILLTFFCHTAAAADQKSFQKLTEFLQTVEAPGSACDSMLLQNSVLRDLDPLPKSGLALIEDLRRRLRSTKTTKSSHELNLLTRQYRNFAAVWLDQSMSDEALVANFPEALRLFTQMTRHMDDFALTHREAVFLKIHTAFRDALFTLFVGHKSEIKIDPRAVEGIMAYNVASFIALELRKLRHLQLSPVQRVEVLKSLAANFNVLVSDEADDLLSWNASKSGTVFANSTSWAPVYYAILLPAALEVLANVYEVTRPATAPTFDPVDFQFQAFLGTLMSKITDLSVLRTRGPEAKDIFEQALEELKEAQQNKGWLLWLQRVERNQTS
ncbi:MAG: hypothetical protein AB7N80_14330 [Bdellovibrionales bacterium]